MMLVPFTRLALAILVTGLVVAIPVGAALGVVDDVTARLPDPTAGQQDEDVDAGLPPAVEGRLDAAESRVEGAADRVDGVACSTLVERLQPRVDAWSERMLVRWERLVDSVEDAHDELVASRSRAAAWSAAVEAWDQRAAQLHAENQAEFLALAEEALGSCASWVGLPPDPWPLLRLPYVTSQDRPDDPDKPESYYERLDRRAERVDDTKWKRMSMMREALQSQCSARMAQASDATERDELDRDCSRRIFSEYREQYHELRRTGEVHGQFGGMNFGFDPEHEDFYLTGKYIGARGSFSERHVSSLYCQGPDYIDLLSFAAGAADFRPWMGDDGNPFRLRDSDGAVFFEIHDAARCTANYASTERVSAIHLDLSDRLSCERAASGDLRCLDGGRELVVLLHDGSLDVGSGNNVTLQGRATVFVADVVAGVQEAVEAAAETVREVSAREVVYEQAVRERRVGVEALIAKVDDASIRADHAPLGDLEFRVTGSPRAIDVYVESRLGEGKSISLDLKNGLFLDALLRVEVFDVAEDGTETPIPVVVASSLEDALDPLDDGEVIEYWLEETAEGYHLVVSIPHFSEKRIHLEPDYLGSVGIPAPGLALLAPMLVAAAVVAVRRRA